MGKRKTASEDHPNGPKPKRHKVFEDQQAVKRESVDITSSSHLRRLLTFQQDEADQKRRSIQAFKVFLEAVVYGEASIERSRKIDILLAFARSEAKQGDEHDSLYLSGLMQSWSFASQSNNNGLLSAIPAILALLLKTVSSLIDLRDFGIQVCKTLLRRDQLKLIDRGLSANKSQEYLISPCLRLLTEIISFDGGILGKRLYDQRETTFKRLNFFLGMTKPISVENGVLKRKPSVRDNAVHYLLANIKLQALPAVSDLISQPGLIKGLFQCIGQDLPSLTSNILEVCHHDIAANREITPDIKSRFFNEKTLIRLLEVRDQHIGGASSEHDHSVGIKAQELLMNVCSNARVDSLACGESNNMQDLHTSEESRLAASDWPSQQESKAHSSLASFIQYLKPFSNTMDKDLILKAFSACPELVTDYFSKKESFSYDPKLSATWIGYSNLLYSVIELPLPEKLFKAVPAAPHTIIDHLLPKPLNRKTLERSLNQKHLLIKLFATRLLVKALQKLDDLSLKLKSLEPHTDMNAIIPKIKAQLCQRCPEISVITAAFKEACNLDSSCLRENLARLISLYHTTLPRMILEDNFDISFTLTDRLRSRRETTNKDGHQGFYVLELDSFFVIAHESPEIRWWHKPVEDMLLSPFTTVLQLYAESNEVKTKVQEKVRDILRLTTTNYYILGKTALLPSQVQSPLDALVISLKCFQESPLSGAIYKFLDNCVCRLVRKPVNYESDRQELNVAQDRMSTSLLAVVFAEQWQFLVRSAPYEDSEVIAHWVALFLKLLMSIGEDRPTLEQIFKRIKETTPDDKINLVSDEGLENPISERQQQIIDAYTEDLQPKHISTEVQDVFDIQSRRLENQILLCKPSVEAKDHPELHVWEQKDVQEVIDDGILGKLVLCLCSAYEEVRRQALSSMRRFMLVLKNSGYSEWQPIFVLLGEVAESVEDIIRIGSYSYFAGELGSRMLQVLANPLHFMYGKVNKFLTKGPRWDLSKLPSQWLVKVLLHPPTESSHRWQEVYWVLQVLYHGLRTPKDMESYRRCNVFEWIFDVTNFLSWPRDCDQLRWQIVSRCSFVEGSTTLITRSGVLAWIRVQQTVRNGDEALLDANKAQLLHLSDPHRTAPWRR